MYRRKKRKIRLVKLDLNKVDWVLHDSGDLWSVRLFIPRTTVEEGQAGQIAVTHTSDGQSWAVGAEDFVLEMSHLRSAAKVMRNETTVPMLKWLTALHQYLSNGLVLFLVAVTFFFKQLFIF